MRERPSFGRMWEMALRTTRIVPFLLALLAVLAAAVPARAQDPAEEAWRAGRLDQAERLYTERLASNPNDPSALHRLALMHAWKERYDESLVLFDRLLRVVPGNLEARVDRARVVAWKGDPAAAAAALDALIAENPGYLPALQARAQFASWAGAFDRALADYGRILEITPGSRAVELERARVLSWASRLSAAEAVYDSLLRADPNDREALMGLAQVLGWASRLDSAAAVYRRVLAADPANVEALRGVARTAAWRGRLIEAERRWRAVLARHPNDAAALVGLSQTLRWQGRSAAALEAARRAVQVAPTNRDARTELTWAWLPTRPRLGPSFTYESDSDGNRISTFTSGAGFRPAPRLEVRGDAYLRQAGVEDESVPDGQAYGAAFTVWTQAEPGWSATGSVGASASDREGNEARPSWRAALTSPGRYPLVATLAYARQPLDASALLIQREVETEEVTLSGRLSPGAGVVLAFGGGVTNFVGRVSRQRNTRAAWNLALTRRSRVGFTFGAAARTFGFDEDLNDGYFDPDFYGIAEALGRFDREWRRWALETELAPGVQQVGEDGDRSGTLRATGGITYLVAPGRRLGLSAVYANAGLQRLSPDVGGEGYRYYAVGINGAWTF